MTKTKNGALFRIPIKGAERVYLSTQHAKRVRAKLSKKRGNSDLKIIGSIRPRVADLADQMYEGTPIGMPAKIGLRNIGYEDEYVLARASKFLKNLGLTGAGLYANTDYLKGDIIIPYRGALWTDKEVEDNSERFVDNHYLFDVLAVDKDSLEVGMVEDAQDPEDSNAARYVNSADFEEGQNSRFIQIGNHIFLQAIKHIKKGEEILSYYGHDNDYIIGKKNIPKARGTPARKRRR